MKSFPPETPRASRACLARLVRVAAVLASVGLIPANSSCSRQQSASAPPRAAPEVDFVTIAAQPITLTKELPGRTSAFRVAEVRARVSGIVLKRLFTEGSDVVEGQELFSIDPAPYQAALESAQAALARAKANVASTEAQAERFKDLIGAHAVSQQEYDNAQAARDAALADRASSEAAVRVAGINLGYTRVTAPISGRIGRSAVTEGAYVQQASATLLATVQQLNPLYVDLTQSSNELLRLKQAIESGRLQSASDAAAAKVELLFEDGKVYGQTGTIQFSDVSVDPATSSVVVRALFPNPGTELLPGMFVRARIAEASLPDAILAPQPAVSRNAKGEATALVVGADDRAEQRILKTDRAVGGEWLVSEGLKPGDRLIVSNLQRIRPGAPIRPVPAGGGAPVAAVR